MTVNKDIQLQLCVLNKIRLDLFLSQHLSDISRKQVQEWIKDGHVTVNEKTITKASHALTPRDTLNLIAELTTMVENQPQAIALDIIYEDDALMVVNKPAGLVVHPGAGIPDQTLLNAILYHAPDNCHLARAGIVHRLDQYTSGLMVIAKTLEAYHLLVEAFKERTVTKRYQAIVAGVMKISGSIDAPIGRHSTQRTKMAVMHRGKPALTHYRIMKRYQHFTHVELDIETGRTHQIRVHMAHLKHPIVGDHVYSQKRALTQLHPEIALWYQAQAHQLLQATQLSFEHPVLKTKMSFTVPDNQALKHALDLLNQYDT